MSQILRMTKQVAARDWASLDHYLVAPYASIEGHYQRVVVIDPSVPEPTWLVRPRARVADRRTVLALVLPALSALTLDLARQLTSIHTDYIGVRVWPRTERAAGRMDAHRLALMATRVTADGPQIDISPRSA
ncbi:hypothetical protein [Gordonia alkanivorans]|uniref:hypothetical protein n=1 Tax=Gordonia alkanivorans TaxID=84096 RepID=UPI0004B6E39E|nr:hypothetical protein [Gordonia alkanivorans]